MTATATSTSSPTRSPPTSWEVKVFSSPADMPSQRLVEAVEHAAAADLVGHAGHLGALDDLAVLGGLEVDDHEVAVGGRALDVGEGGEPLAQRLDLLLDVGVGERRCRRPAASTPS